MPSEKSTFNFNKTHNQILKIKQVTHCLQFIGKNAGLSRMGTFVCVICDRSFYSRFIVCVKNKREVCWLFIWRCSDSMIKIFIAIKQICFVRFIDFTHYCVARSGYKTEGNEKIGTCIYLLLFYSGRIVASPIQLSPSLAHIYTHESQERPRKMRKLNGFCCATKYTKSQACTVI